MDEVEAMVQGYKQMRGIMELPATTWGRNDNSNPVSVKRYTMWQRLKSWLGPKLFSMNVKTGERGERLAAVFLQNQGYAVVARNWRDPNDRRDELDLVCRDGEVLVFVEVKTRAAGALVAGYYAVDKRKKKVVRRAATAYLRSLQPRPHTFRFDVIEVAVSAAGSTEVRHFENIELFPKHFRP